MIQITISKDLFIVSAEKMRTQRKMREKGRATSKNHAEEKKTRKLKQGRLKWGFQSHNPDKYKPLDVSIHSCQQLLEDWERG